MKRPWNVAWGNSSSWSCRDDKEMCQTACCTCELDVLPFAYQTYSDFSDVLVAVAVAVGLAKAPHGWPLNWAPFQMNIVWCAFSITKKNTCSPLKKKKTRHITTCEDSLFLSSLKKRRKGDSRQTFEVAAVRTSGLDNLVFSRQTGFRIRSSVY